MEYTQQQHTVENVVLNIVRELILLRPCARQQNIYNDEQQEINKKKKMNEKKEVM